MKRFHRQIKTMLLISVLSLGHFSAYGMNESGKFDASKNLDRVTNNQWKIRAPWRLTLGLMNAGLSWTQMGVEPIRSVRQEGEDIFKGVFDAAAGTAYYAAIGVWDIGTFWVPGKLGRDIAVRDCIMKTFKFYAPAG